MAKETIQEYIIPPDLLGKDLWLIKPDYHRDDGAKFVMDENLTLRDRKFLVSQGIKLVLRGGAKSAAKAEISSKKKVTTNQEADAQSADEGKDK